MRQRLGLAAALLRDPALLILDEPSNGMDPAGIREFRALLRSLADDGTTVFLSSHLLAEVEQVCDRVAVINAGRLVEQGPVTELTATRPVVRVVLDETDLPAALGLLSDWAVRAEGRETLLLDGADGRAVNRALGAAGIWARQIRIERPSLEEAFLPARRASWSSPPTAWTSTSMTRCAPGPRASCSNTPRPRNCSSAYGRPPTAWPWSRPP
jgi:ABC-2 type transport system ATP-binding protein